MAGQGGLLSLRAELAARLARYDEEALAALASRGLLRRAAKDLERAAPEVEGDSTVALDLVFSGHRIRFDAGGPAAARCSCPASGTCQHILAAMLWLQRQTPAAASAEGADAPEVATLDALHEQLLGWDTELLVRHAGRAGYRWALQLVADLDLERDLQIGGDRHLVIGFRQPRISFRYMGGAIDDMVADRAPPQAAKYRVAAVLAYRSAQGRPIDPLDAGTAPRRLSAQAEATDASRRRLRAGTRTLLLECVQLGLSHLSPAMRDRCATLAVWAQGTACHRLAGMLRRIADHVGLLLERSGMADEHRLLEEITLAYALVSALESGAQRGGAPAHLLGRARSRYDDAASLELFGLGALPWRSAAGYTGLTMLFWSPADGDFLACTDARPGFLRGFNPMLRYRAAGPWPGLGSPAHATGRRLRLQSPSISGDGRLSTSGRTHALVEEDRDTEALYRSLQPWDDWDALRRSREGTSRSLLSPLGQAPGWVALRPARTGAASFDAVAQVLRWPLFDGAGRKLEAVVPYSEFHQTVIHRLERDGGSCLEGGALLVARLLDRGAALAVEPLSIVRGAPRDAAAVDALYFDGAPSMPPAGAGPAGAISAAGPPAPAQRRVTILDEVHAWLLAQAERGVAGHRAGPATVELQALTARARDAGFACFPADAGDTRIAEHLLRAQYLCMQYAKVLAGASTDE